MQHYEFNVQQDKQQIEALIAFSSMATLITGPEARVGVFNPVYRDGCFYLHLHRQDPQFLEMEKLPRVRLVFFDFLCNIPSYWVHEKYGGAATSYYRFADFDCAGECFRDVPSIARITQYFLDQYQQEGGYEALSEQSKLYQSSFEMLGVVKLSPVNCQAKWKLGQNRTVAQRQQIIQKLRERNHGNDLRAAQEVKGWMETH